MSLFSPWQDTISLLSGAKPTRTERPGERFDEDELLRDASSPRGWRLPAKETKKNTSANRLECSRLY